jgi:hypothetical protein
MNTQAKARLALLAAAVLAAAPAAAQTGDATDPRIGLSAGWSNAGQAIRGMRLLAHRDKPQGFFNPQQPGDFGFANADLAFQGNHLFLGGYYGFQVWDISDPANPRVRATHVCPGGQGDVSVHGNLLFMSVEETRGRTDCGTQGAADSVSADRFRGVRIFDISNLDQPRQVAAVQTCRGSHTHTLLTDPDDRENVYVYVQGTGRVRPAAELQGCSGRPPAEDPNTSYFRIEVIRVPLARPQDARIVSTPRLFADSAGNVAGLWPGGTHGEGTQQTSQTNQCHDITVYPELGLAAGACSGNGILLDIRDPANPVRVDEVVDPNFAYWHSATFNNAGTTVLYTDEWGGGTAPRCRSTDRPTWGADALFRLSNNELRQVGYYKLPGRDIMVQAWYQGGISIFDFTDPAAPAELAFFDRGPATSDQMAIGGFWSAYWYNGRIYGSEIGRGLDVFELTPSAALTANEIEAAKQVRMQTFNPQNQQRITWAPSFAVARAYADQLWRSRGLGITRSILVESAIDRAERMSGASRRAALARIAAELDDHAAASRDAAKVRMLASVLRELR